MMEQASFREELQLLGRVLREEQFRFVLAEYNHLSAIQQTEDFVRKNYPKRAILHVNIKGNHFRGFSQQIKDFRKGIVFIPDFDELFRPENDDFRIAFNQRRDWLAEQPLALIAFLPAGGLPTVMKGMPDFWSRRDAELSLLADLPARSGLVMQEPRISSIGGLGAAGKAAELERLRAEIAAAGSGSFSQLDNLYRQLLPLLEDLGDYPAGLAAARDYHRLAHLQDDAHGGLPSLLYAHERLACFHRYLGQYADAGYHARKALELAETSGDEAVIAEMQNNLATVLQDLGDYVGAKALLEKALASDEHNFGELHPITAVRYSNLAVVLQALGDYAGAKALLEKALASDERTFGALHPSTAVRYSNLATVLQDLGEYAGAKALLEKALASDEHNFGELHPNTAIRYSNLATVFQDLGDYAGARVLLEKAVASAERNFGELHPITAVRYSNLALVLQDLGEYAGAKALLEKALASEERYFGEFHPTTAVTYSNLAVVLRHLGDYAGAKTLLEKALASAERNLGLWHPATAVKYANLASVLMDLKAYSQARPLLEKAQQVFSSRLGAKHPDSEKVKAWLAKLDRLEGKRT
ncbi:MAG: tetratricopeptide repeat protein [Bacteroidia bacterium]|nr:tetratricopeptide repeat protein [Bacteroidia bacterium]